MIEISGYTVSPGLVDLHVHLGSPEMKSGEELGPSMMVGLSWTRSVLPQGIDGRPWSTASRRYTASVTNSVGLRISTARSSVVSSWGHES